MLRNSRSYPSVCPLNKGFTLVEILVCVAIISVLAAILLPVITGARRRGYDSENVSNLRQLYVAAQLYRESEGEFPASPVFLIPRYCSSPSVAASRNDPYPEGWPVHTYNLRDVYPWYSPGYKVTFGGALELSLTPYQLQFEAREPSASRGVFADVTPLQNIMREGVGSPRFFGCYRRLTEDGAILMLPSPVIYGPPPRISCMNPAWFLIDVSYEDRMKECSKDER